MAERMTQDRVSELVHTDYWTPDDCEDAQRELLLARESERMLEDRIHALEVQQKHLQEQLNGANAMIASLQDMEAKARGDVVTKNAEIASLRTSMAEALNCLPNSFANSAREILSRGLKMP